jgi:hypothetical protein
MTAITPVGRFDFGRVLARGFRLALRRPFTLLAIAVALDFLPTAAFNWLSASVLIERTPTGAADLSALAWRLGLALLLSAVGWVLQGCVGMTIVGDSERRQFVVIDVLRRAPLLFILGLVALVPLVLAYILFVVPGILLGLAWSLAANVAGVEGCGVLGSLRRSFALTENHRAMLLGLFLAYGLTDFGVVGAIRAVLGVPLLANTSQIPPYFYDVVQPAVGAFMTTVLAVLVSSAYLELRELKDGAPADGGFFSVFD